MDLLNAVSPSTSAPQAKTALAQYSDPDDQVIYFPSGPANTKTFLVVNLAKRQLTVISLGIDGTTQIPALLASWTGTTTPDQAGNVFNAAALLFVASVPTSLVGSWLSVVLVGHSYGGAQMHWMAKLLRGTTDINGGTLFVYTYGAPKEEVRGGQFGSSGIYYRRMFTSQDPVPKLPPGPGDMGSVWVLVGVPTARKWERWFHWWQGYFINSDGSMGLSDNSATLQNQAFVLTLASWISGGTAFGSPDHSLLSYTQFALAIPNALIARRLTSGTTSGGSWEPTPVRVLQGLRAEQVATIALNADANRADTAAGIQSGIQIVPGTRYRGERIQGEQWVLYGDQLVIPVRTLRARRALVRYLNLHPIN